MKKHLAVLAVVFLLLIPTSGLFAAAQEEMAAEKMTFTWLGGGWNTEIVDDSWAEQIDPGQVRRRDHTREHPEERKGQAQSPGRLRRLSGRGVLERIGPIRPVFRRGDAVHSGVVLPAVRARVHQAARPGLPVGLELQPGARHGRRVLLHDHVVRGLRRRHRLRAAVPHGLAGEDRHGSRMAHSTCSRRPARSSTTSRKRRTPGGSITSIPPTRRSTGTRECCGGS